jgi:hypothetical protein
MDSFSQFINKKLVIVDVQPSYKNYIWWLKDFANFVNPYQNILVLYNGPDLGFENKLDIAKFYLSNGIKKETIYRMKWFEKNYAFFRDAMDQCWERDGIIKIIKYMLKNNKRDIRQLTEEDVKKINVPELIFDNLEEVGFFIPDLAKHIRKWNGADIVGGGLDECLEEVMLLAEAMNVKFNIIHQFTY